MLILRLITIAFFSLVASSLCAKEFISDIEYGNAAGERLLLDISIPDGEGPFPVTLLIHGGGWSAGDKSGTDKPNSSADITPWFEPLTDGGFIWVSINYRLAPAHRWPACLEDTHTALAWINEHIAEYQGDKNRVAVIGHSAGGQLAMLTAIADKSIRPQAIVGCAAVTEFEQELPRRGGVSKSLQDLFDRTQEITPESLALLRSTSPLNLLEPDLPPVLLIHGTADPTTPYIQSLNLQKRLSVLNTQCDLISIPDAPHRLRHWVEGDPEWQSKMVTWLKNNLYATPPSENAYWLPGKDDLHILERPQQLPTENGEARDILTKRGCNLSVQWKNRKLEQVEVVSTKGEGIYIRYGKNHFISLKGEIGSHWTLDGDLKLISQTQSFHAYVAPDGSGEYHSIQQAIDHVPTNRQNAAPWIIQVAPGTYRERLIVPSDKPAITLRGYKPNNAIITFDLNANGLDEEGKKLGTFRTATVEIHSDNFTAENITFENAFGLGAQALAISLTGDRNVFRNCRFLGWQDTILTRKGRHYFENCYIEGHVDYIFGAAICYFEQCHLHNLRDGYITAASTPENEPYGYVFNKCRITAANPDIKTYLGRPWRDSAAVTFIDTSMSANVRDEGWNNWSKPEREQTSRYYEFNSFGPGANPEKRVAWANKAPLASSPDLSPIEVLKGSDNWNPLASQQAF